LKFEKVCLLFLAHQPLLIFWILISEKLIPSKYFCLYKQEAWVIFWESLAALAPSSLPLGSAEDSLWEQSNKMEVV